MTHDPRKFSDAERAFHRGHSIEDSYRPDCRMCGGVATQTAPVTSVKVHDPLCSVRWPCDHPAHFNMRCSCICGRICQCDLIAQVRADERRWVTACAGDELLNHKITDGVCACGMDAPDALEHLAWIVSDYVRHSLKPEHEVALP